ncbi:MAG TPA: hypothetical protein ENL06_02755 [Candidatus Portnoybacteria bacterium]|nr:hypothetical protein [Candidatus Portnoybacteria bacterium]
MNNEIEKLNLGGIPEKIKEEGVYVHYREKAKVGDTVEALNNVMDGEIPKGTTGKITEIVIEPTPNVRGFLKRIKIEGFEGEYNPKKFKKLEE